MIHSLSQFLRFRNIVGRIRQDSNSSLQVQVLSLCRQSSLGQEIMISLGLSQTEKKTLCRVSCCALKSSCCYTPRTTRVTLPLCSNKVRFFSCSFGARSTQIKVINRLGSARACDTVPNSHDRFQRDFLMILSFCEVWMNFLP